MSRFRTAEVNKLKLGSLFIDYRSDSKQEALYALSDIDKEYKGKTYPSLYKLYIEMSDITEYNFANKYFESYQHWDLLCQEEWFKPYIARWRKELELKIKSQALVEIIAQSESSDPKKRLEAAKYLYEKVYLGDKNTKRVPKEEIKKEAKKIAREAKIIDEHWEAVKEYLN